MTSLRYSIHDSTATGTARSVLANAALVGTVVLAAALFGIGTRSVGLLATLWPANAILLGLLVRCPQLATPAGWVAALLGFLGADLLTGSSLTHTLLLTTGNLCGILVGFTLFSRLHEDDKRLRRPLSVLYLASICAASAAASGCAGAIIGPILLDLNPFAAWAYWFATEAVNYTSILPVVLTLPGWRWPLQPRRHRRQPLITRLAPVITLLISCIAGVVIGGPGAVAFPVPALLWCALAYTLPVTAVLTLMFSMFSSIVITSGQLNTGMDFSSSHALLSLRIGITLMSLAPITVGSVMAARNALLQQLRHMAAHDPLTGLFNRRAFADNAHTLLHTLARTSQSAAMLMLDVDRFKRINDAHGHATGDQVLINFARVTAGQLQEGDVIDRLGGEEFAVLTASSTMEEALALAERIRIAFAAAPITLSTGRQVNATLSIGIAFATHAPATIEDMLGHADRMLYEAKQSGRNRCLHCAVPDPDHAAAAAPLAARN